MLTDVRAVLLSAGISFTAIFAFFAGFGFNIAGIGAGASIFAKFAIAGAAFSLTLPRLTGRRFRICGLRRSHAHGKSVRHSTINGHAWNFVACASWCRGRGRRSGLGHRVAFEPGT